MILELKNYINKHSSNTIRSRARSIKLKFISKDDQSYVFSYLGSEKYLYSIKVLFEKDKIKSYCNCPFDYHGLCKHEVAAIQYVIDDCSDKTEHIKNTATLANNSGYLPHNKIRLTNHLITKDFLHLLARENGILYYNAYATEIQDFNETCIKTIFSNWHMYKQTIRYDQAKQILTLNCTCRYSKNKICEHELSALNHIINVFNVNFFSPNYIDSEKEGFLKNYGLTLKDDYQKFFEFSVGNRGIKVIEKVKNIVPSLDLATKKLLPIIDQKTKDSFYVLKHPPTQEHQHGIGFCFSLYKDSSGKNFFNFIPFKAKYKKHSKEFISSFKELNSFNFIEQLKKGLNNTDKSVALKAVEFSDSFASFVRDFSIESFRGIFIDFNHFIDQNTNYSFFVKKETQSLVKNNLQPIFISKENPQLSFTLSESDDFYTLKPKISIENKNYQLNSVKAKFFPLFCLVNQTLYKFKSPYEYLYINRMYQRSQLNFLKKDYDKLYSEFLYPISKHFNIENKLKHKKKKSSIKEENLKKQVFLSDYEGEFVIFKLGIQYKDTLVLMHSKEIVYDKDNQDVINRNEVFELDFLEQFKSLHPDFKEQEDVFFLSPKQLIEQEWLLKVSQKMEQMGIAIFGAKELKSFKFNLNKPVVSVGVKSETDWFDLKIEVKYGKEKVSLKDIKKAVLRKDKYVTLSDGTLGVLPTEWLKKFSYYFRAGEIKNNAVKISNYQFNIIDQLYDELEKAPDFLLELKHKKEQLQNLNLSAVVTVPLSVKAKLRPYQEEGLKWLAFLEDNKLGGCLADDMGLGKTLQIIAFIAYLKIIRKTELNNLVVTPKSLIFNWESEINKFCPSLKTLTYTGLNRKAKLASFTEADVILTTYGTVLNDVETLKKTSFTYIILDESQAIKNPNSKRYKALRMLKSENRLALTGTPIENNTFDLYTQMNFLNPGLLGTMSHFKTEFSDAIDKAKNKEASTLLSKMIHPFLLRRTKKQVATELPEKSEIVLYCEMSAEQRKVYNFFKDKYRDYLLEKIDENGEAKSQMYVLEGLTKLRQICNSPELLNEQEGYGKSSVKLDILIDNIRSKTSRHKVLVFSQFTSMLQLVKNRLNNENISYEYLDGQTQNREEKVNNFQNTEALRVFLISLKAGGVGLNLTAADYVFLVDPWWNPAVESQAIDRSHRIGQTKKVIAYKMICKDTIEEKIIDLQKNKKQVSNSVIQVDMIKKSFNTKEIKELFS
ncbi:MAG: SNF2-related protein [Tenacibaculum sp.]